MDVEHASCGQCGSRSVLAPGPGAAGDDNDVGLRRGEGLGERRFEDDAAVALDRRAQHRAIAVRCRARPHSAGDRHADARPTDQWQAGKTSGGKQPDVTGHQPRSRSREQPARGGKGALSVDIGAGRRRLDQNDLAAIHGIHMVERDHGVGSCRQRLARFHRDRRHRQRVVGAGADAFNCTDCEPVDRGAINRRDRRGGMDILAEHAAEGLVQRDLFRFEATRRAIDPSECRLDRDGAEFSHDINARA